MRSVSPSSLLEADRPDDRCEWKRAGGDRQLAEFSRQFSERLSLPRVTFNGDLENFVSAQSGLAVWSRTRFTMEYLISILN